MIFEYFFTTGGVAKILPITYSQLRHWDRMDFLKPRFRGTGKWRRFYGVSEMILLACITVWRRTSSIQRIRKHIKDLRDTINAETDWHDLDKVHILLDKRGGDFLICEKVIHVSGMNRFHHLDLKLLYARMKEFAAIATEEEVEKALDS